MTDGLITFLRARLDEDRDEALAASPGPWTPDGDEYEVLAADGITVCDGFALSNRQLQATVRHIARHDPARALREVTAKRELLDEHLAAKHSVCEDSWYTCPAATEDRDGGVCSQDDMHGEPCECGRDDRLARTLQLLALPYADHPDYQESWRP
ncbi:DUF6221 family protein [Streptomyces sp. NPDC005953]|uniref:DUF6221 family protein n=1 Tax=Streptomyces sp. NPDC005953 TaxID=3156719 RepID=UPI00340EA477